MQGYLEIKMMSGKRKVIPIKAIPFIPFKGGAKYAIYDTSYASLILVFLFSFFTVSTAWSNTSQCSRPTLRAGGADGHFGNGTRNAVVAFQRIAFPGQANQHDGIIGGQTWAKLGCTSSNTAAGHPTNVGGPVISLPSTTPSTPAGHPTNIGNPGSGGNNSTASCSGWVQPTSSQRVSASNATLSARTDARRGPSSHSSCDRGFDYNSETHWAWILTSSTAAGHPTNVGGSLSGGSSTAPSTPAGHPTNVGSTGSVVNNSTASCSGWVQPTSGQRVSASNATLSARTDARRGPSSHSSCDRGIGRGY